MIVNVVYVCKCIMKKDLRKVKRNKEDEMMNLI